MGFVTQFFIKPAKPALVQLPSGSFMIDSRGKISTSTLPGSFAAAHIQAIGDRFLEAFRVAETAKVPLSELVIEFPALRLVGRNLRGGALVFVVPLTRPLKDPAGSTSGAIQVDEHFGD